MSPVLNHYIETLNSNTTWGTVRKEQKDTALQELEAIVRQGAGVD